MGIAVVHIFKYEIATLFSYLCVAGAASARGSSGGMHERRPR
jgi:hypothetical protein